MLTANWPKCAHSGSALLLFLFADKGNLDEPGPVSAEVARASAERRGCTQQPEAVWPKPSRISKARSPSILSISC